MKKLVTLTVDNCFQCPHGKHISGKYICREAFEDNGKDIYESGIVLDYKIPEWCPLPDVEDEE